MRLGAKLSEQLDVFFEEVLGESLMLGKQMGESG